jgi:hypothetical protein
VSVHHLASHIKRGALQAQPPRGLESIFNITNETLGGLLDGEVVIQRAKSSRRPVGAESSYTGSASPYGTFDQNGNVMEWTETVIVTSRRVYRGGEWSGASTPPASLREGADPNGKRNNLGFRLGMPVPEPSTGLLVFLGLIGLAGWRRVRT